MLDPVNFNNYVGLESANNVAERYLEAMPAKGLATTLGATNCSNKLAKEAWAVVARFEAKRQALALMEHPNIPARRIQGMRGVDLLQDLAFGDRCHLV